jgi:glycosyltransferase involved in cell wall biosynthesis
MARRAASRLVRGAPATPADRNRVAFYGPMPPASSGIATYDEAVVRGLERIGFTRRIPMDVVWPLGPREIAGSHGYRMGIFQLGNNIEFHVDIYRLAWQQPGIVVLHDPALDDFVRGLQGLGDPLGRISVREAVAVRGLVTDPDVLRNEPLRVPWCAGIVRRSRGVIVHSDFVRRYLEETGCRTPVFVVPHPVIELDEDLRRAEPRARELRAAVRARGGTSLVVAPGDLNAAKCLDVVAQAASTLGPEVHLALVGRTIGGYDAGAAARAAGLGDRLTIAHDVSDEDFRAWLIAADVVVDLRFPHRGEVSGSLIRAMQAGRPSIVSATGTYLEVPDECVVRIAPGPPDRDELASRIQQLVEDAALRSAVGGAAKDHVERLRETEATANGYAEAIEATFDLVRDPVHAALGRWARSLAELGIDEPAVRQGHGLAYARALAGFRETTSKRPGDGPLDSSGPR